MLEHGTVKWWNNRQGWGFIVRPNKSDVYVRHDRICGEGWKQLNPGEMVEFELREGAKGPYAANVKRVSEQETMKPATGVATAEAAVVATQPEVAATSDDAVNLPD